MDQYSRNQQQRAPSPQLDTHMSRPAVTVFMAVYTSAAAFSLEVSEAERLAVRQAYRQKYGVEPPDASVIPYMARVAHKQRGGGEEGPHGQHRQQRRRPHTRPPSPP